MVFVTGQCPINSVLQGGASYQRRILSQQKLESVCMKKMNGKNSVSKPWGVFC
jgi:hypothetical protein